MGNHKGFIVSENENKKIIYDSSLEKFRMVFPDPLEIRDFLNKLIKLMHVIYEELKKAKSETIEVKLLIHKLSMFFFENLNVYVRFASYYCEEKEEEENE